VLFRKKSPHDEAVRDAEKALKQVQKAQCKEVKDAERALDAARQGEEVAKFKDARLFKDRVEKGKETVPLLPGMRAEVEVTGSVAVVQSKYTLKDALTGDKDVKSRRLLGAKYGDEVERTVDTRAVTLTIETDRAGLMLTCKAEDEGAAREFAQQVRVRASDGPDAATARDEAVRRAEQALAELQRRHADQLAEQERSLAQTSSAAESA
jgi:hypothetical protein